MNGIEFLLAAAPASAKPGSGCGHARRRARPQATKTLGHFQHEFAVVLAFEKFEKSFGKSFEAFHDILAGLQFAGGHPLRHVRSGLRVAVDVIHHQHALHGGTIYQERHVVAWTGDGGGAAILRDRSAEDDSGATRQVGERGLENGAADVVKINVDALGAMLAEGTSDVYGFVIDGGIEAEVIDDEAALLGASGDADDVAVLNFGDLPDDGADGSGCGGDDDCVSGLGLAGVEEAKVCGHAGHAEDAEIFGQRNHFCVDFSHSAAVGQRVFLHAEYSGDVIAYREARIAGGGDDADAESAHDFSDGYGRDVGSRFVDPTAHGRVERNVEELDLELAVFRRGGGFFDVGPVGALGHAHGARGEEKLVIGEGHGDSFVSGVFLIARLRLCSVRWRAGVL